MAVLQPGADVTRFGILRVVSSFPPFGGFHERDSTHHLCFGIGLSGDHPFYVVEMLTMPGNMKRVCQGLIVLIAILSVTGELLGSAPPPASHVGPIAPNSPSNPSSIIR